MQLSVRLTAVAGFVTKGNRLADIGTDHGYVPIYLVEKGIIPEAIAMDINEGPLERAKEHINEYGFNDKIKVRLSDGLAKLKENEADTVLIAGMGGNLMVRILENGRDVLESVKELVLSPHSEINLVREYLCENNYEIIDESMVFDGGKYYTIIKAVKGTDVLPYDNIQKVYGRFLVYGEHKVFTDYVDNEKRKLDELIDVLGRNQSEGAKIRLEELKYSLKLNEEIREGNGVNGREH